VERERKFHWEAGKFFTEDSRRSSLGRNAAK
jgi:hypothetical protein